MPRKPTRKTPPPAAAEAYPFEARTNKPTLLIRLGSTSESLPKRQALTVFAEDGAFGTVRTAVGGRFMGGSVQTADYDRVG